MFLKGEGGEQVFFSGGIFVFFPGGKGLAVGKVLF